MSCPFKPAKKTVSLLDGDSVHQQVFSSKEYLDSPPAPDIGDNDKQYTSTQSIEQNNDIEQDTYKDLSNNVSKGDVFEGGAARVNSDLSPEEEFRSTLQKQSKAVYEEMKYDCDAIEQEIGVTKQVNNTRNLKVMLFKMSD
jgi:hypothetical protein